MKLKKINISTLILIGIIAGLIQVLLGVILYLSGLYFGTWSSVTSLSILILCIISGAIWYRKKYMNDMANYSEILLIGILISVTTGIIYALYDIISISYIFQNFINDMIQFRVEVLIKKGTGQNEIDSIIALMRERHTPQSIAIMNFTFVSFFGSTCSLILSFFLKNTTSKERIPKR